MLDWLRELVRKEDHCKPIGIVEKEKCKHLYNEISITYLFKKTKVNLIYDGNVIGPRVTKLIMDKLKCIYCNIEFNRGMYHWKYFNGKREYGLMIYTEIDGIFIDRKNVDINNIEEIEKYKVKKKNG